MIIAIDGPAGTGKSTISKLLAEKIGFFYLDTGAIYRWITFFILEKGIKFDDSSGIMDVVNNIDFSEINDTKIRTKEISDNVAIIAKIPEVRRKVRNIQIEISKKKNIVIEGRDIGTVVFPDAEYKFFLSASVEKRAERRFHEMINNGIECNIDEIKDSILLRDQNDISREYSPLKKAEDAIEIETTGLSIDEVLMKILEIILQ